MPVPLLLRRLFWWIFGQSMTVETRAISIGQESHHALEVQEETLNPSQLPSPRTTPSELSVTPKSCQTVLDHDEIAPLNPIRRVDSFHAKLRKSRLFCSTTSHHEFFVPKRELERLTTVGEVFSALEQASQLKDRPVLDLRSYAETISTSARYIFATLGYLHLEHNIIALLDENVSDEDFPFELHKVQSSGDQFNLKGRGGREIESVCGWADEERENFHKTQWFMKPSTFVEGKHHELDDDEMLPFTVRTVTKSTGGFSKVYFADIHPDHHDFLNVDQCDVNGCQVAIKELVTEEPEVEFMREKEFFETLKEHVPHEHLLKLLATYRWKGKYHFVFPRAKHNLHEFWAATLPVMEKHARWCLDQMGGLVNGLLDIHDCNLRNVETADRDCGPAESIIQIESGEEKFGRHGDLKPANILVFIGLAGALILKIADFGLGKFHGRPTRSNIDWSKVRWSPTYEPPEIRLKMLISRQYDMWSFGCILLEFASWMLEGRRSSELFSEARLQPDSNPAHRELKTDEFYTITDKAKRKAVVREGVIQWVLRLHAHPDCTQFIHDLLDLVMGHILVIKPSDRYTAKDLDAAFRQLRARAEDRGYLVAPVPYPIAVQGPVYLPGLPTMSEPSLLPEDRTSGVPSSPMATIYMPTTQHRAPRVSRTTLTTAGVRAAVEEGRSMSPELFRRDLSMRSKTWPIPLTPL